MDQRELSEERERAGAAVVRSEEELVVAGERRWPVERVLVRKVVVEEERTVRVVVRREELRVEREPLGEGADEGGSPAEDDGLVLELVLHSEEPEVTTRVVPRERVRVLRERISDQEVVSAELRSERIDVERER